MVVHASLVPGRLSAVDTHSVVSHTYPTPPPKISTYVPSPCSPMITSPFRPVVHSPSVWGGVWIQATQSMHVHVCACLQHIYSETNTIHYFLSCFCMYLSPLHKLVLYPPLPLLAAMSKVLIFNKCSDALPKLKSRCPIIYPHQDTISTITAPPDNSIL